VGLDEVTSRGDPGDTERRCAVVDEQDRLSCADGARKLNRKNQAGGLKNSIQSGNQPGLQQN